MDMPESDPSRESPPTIYDVAQLAGVSPSAVSRALSRPGRLAAETERRIRDAASELGYRTNPIARALPTGRTATIGVVVTDITNPVFFDLIRGAERAAAALDYTLILAESQESGARETEAVSKVVSFVDGIVLASTRMDDQQLTAVAAKKPLVLINRESEGLPSIVPDIGPGVEAALDELVSAGRRSVAYLGGPQGSWISVHRWNRLLDGAVARGLRIVQIPAPSPTVDGGAATLSLVRAAGVDAVVSYNDLMAIGLLQAAGESGLGVPGDLSIIGFDDIFGAGLTSPPLSTIRTPLGAVGEAAVQYLVRGVQAGGGLRTEFVRRGTVGPVARTA